VAVPSYFIAIYSSGLEPAVRSRHLIAPVSYPVKPGGLLFEVDARYRQETLEKIDSFSLPALRIGGAFTRTAAVFAALLAPGTILPYGREKGFLASFPLRHLSLQEALPPGFLDTMHSWGIRTFGELSAVPSGELVARLGQGALKLQRAAAGEDEGLPETLPEVPVFREKREFEHPIESTEALLFPLGEMVESVCRRVSGSGKAVQGIELVLNAEDGGRDRKKTETSLPSRNSRLLASLLRLELETVALSSGITSIEMEAYPARARHLQYSLLEPETLAPEEKELTIAMAEKSWPESRVGVPAVLDSHVPDPGCSVEWRETRFFREKKARGGTAGDLEGKGNRSQASISMALRRERPPRPVSLREQDIVSCAGPWKYSGGWWSGEESLQSWSREEWDVELKSGELLRIFWHFGESRWYLEGVYD